MAVSRSEVALSSAAVAAADASQPVSAMAKRPKSTNVVCNLARYDRNMLAGPHCSCSPAGISYLTRGSCHSLDSDASGGGLLDGSERKAADPSRGAAGALESSAVCGKSSASTPTCKTNQTRSSWTESRGRSVTDSRPLHRQVRHPGILELTEETHPRKRPNPERRPITFKPVLWCLPPGVANLGPQGD